MLTQMLIPSVNDFFSGAINLSLKTFKVIEGDQKKFEELIKQLKNNLNSKFRDYITKNTQVLVW